MTLNYPGPYTIEIKYQVSGLEHSSEFSVVLTSSPAAGTPFSGIGVVTKDLNQVPLDQAIEAYLTSYLDLFNTATAVSEVTLWKNVFGTFERTWVSSYSPTANAGTSANPAVLAQQITLSFRSSNGGILKIVALEGFIDGNSVEPLVPGAGSETAGLAATVIDDTSIIKARDDGTPVAALKLSRGQNERVFRKRYR